MQNQLKDVTNDYLKDSKENIFLFRIIKLLIHYEQL
jgi:hypothetical protein